jgi:transcriptional regulator with XRE-family HTH domain
MVSMPERRDFTRRFGERLRQARNARGLSQEGLAHAAGLHRTHVSLIERNRRSVRLETLERLAKALRVEPASLIPIVIGSVNRSTGKNGGSHHPDMLRFDLLFPYIREYQTLAAKHGIGDIFQDNGGKILQTLIILNMTFTGRREGNDARDEDGNEYELKTVNIDLTKSFSTNHHLNPAILRKYRSVRAWYFSIYHGIELVEIYRMSPEQLEEDFFAKWERKWHDSGGRDINNPKIPISYVRKKGELVYQDPVNDRL